MSMERSLAMQKKVTARHFDLTPEIKGKEETICPDVLNVNRKNEAICDW